MVLVMMKMMVIVAILLLLLLLLLLRLPPLPLSITAINYHHHPPRDFGVLSLHIRCNYDLIVSVKGCSGLVEGFSAEYLAGNGNYEIFLFNFP